MLEYVFAITTAIAATAFVRTWREFSVFKTKYTPLTDIEGEVARLQKKSTALQLDRQRLEEAIQKERASEEEKQRKFEASLCEKREKFDAGIQQTKDEFNNLYAAAKQKFERLTKDIGLLEENLEDISYGIYKPHYSFETSAEYKRRLDGNYEQQKSLVRNGDAVNFAVEWTVGGSKSEGKRMQKQYGKLMLRAFNGECDAAIAKVAWNNVDRMEERVSKAFEAINNLGSVMSISITREYLNLRLAELRLSYEYEEKKHAELEEQRRIRAQIREEEKVQKELETARQKAEAEEKRYAQALEQARAEIGTASGAKLEKLSGKIHELEQQLSEAQQKQRAISQAQLTKSGHIYVISNIGSFGEGVFKIGMTRRLEPTERVQELGDASVPFGFDIHAMIPSDNAPALEHEIHQHFAERQVNRVNSRKEFFRVTLDELGDFLHSKDVTMELTALAEAREYRETLAMLKKDKEGNERSNENAANTMATALPETIL